MYSTLYGVRMSDLTVFSDVHLGKGTPTTEQIRPSLSRALDGDIVVCCGDVFDTPWITGAVRVEDMQVLADELYDSMMISGRARTVVLLTGNHDITTDGRSALRPFSKASNGRVFVVDEVLGGVWKFEERGTSYGFISWVKDLDTFKQRRDQLGKCDYLFCHQGVKGAHVNSVVMDGFPSDEIGKLAEVVFCGDYHEPNVIDNVVIPGSLTPLSFADADDRGFYTVNNSELNFHPIEHPKFITVRNRLPKKMDDRDYYRVVNPDPGVKSSPNVKVKQEVEGNTKVAGDSAPGKTISGMIRTYSESRGKPEMAKPGLIMWNRVTKDVA